MKTLKNVNSGQLKKPLTLLDPKSMLNIRGGDEATSKDIVDEDPN